MPSEPIIPTAERTLRLIELLLSRTEGWSPQELLLELDLSRSTLFDLLRGLRALGYVEQSARRGRYVPGPRLAAWRIPQPGTQDLLAAFYQEAAALEACSPGAPNGPRETLALVTPAGAAGWMVSAQLEGSAQVRSVLITGQVYASLPAAAQVLTLAPLPEVGQNGYALTTGSDSNDLAIPICRDGRTPQAALLLSAPAFRWPGETLTSAWLPALREMAAHLSYRLGAPVYAPYQARPRDPLQAMTPLSADEIATFLRGPYAASLACIRPDGKPHVIPVWQEWDGQAFTVIAWQGAQWADYLAQNNNVSLTIDEPWAPLRRVVVQGSAEELATEPEDLQRLLQRMAQRYLGKSAGPGPVNSVQRAFRIQPGALRGWRGL